MAIKKKGSNQLLLLAGTALVLCVAVLSNGNNSVSDSLQGMVLSDRDEARGNKEVEERNEETKESSERIREEEKKRIELKAEDNKKKIEQTREEEKKRLEIKIREKKSSPEPTQTRDQDRERDEERNQENDEIEDENELEDENEFEVETNGVKATTDSPLKLNPKTNELSVTSKDGETVKVVVLPDQAVENLTSNKKVEIVGETTLEENSETGEFEYKAKVVESKKLFGLFDIKLNKEYKVSSEDGNIEEVELTGIDRLLNLISF